MGGGKTVFLIIMASLKTNKSNLEVPSAHVVDDAVGMLRWFVAIVRPNTEIASRQKLQHLSIQAYVASQPEIRVWANGRKKMVDRILIRSRVFIRCSPRKRLEIVKLPFILRFMTDRAATVNNEFTTKLATIPDSQMESLMFMLGHADSPVTFSDHYHQGDKVRVIRGKLKGLEGEIIHDCDGSTQLEIAIDFLGSARLQISPADIQKITPCESGSLR